MNFNILKLLVLPCSMAPIRTLVKPQLISGVVVAVVFFFFFFFFLKFNSYNLQLGEVGI